MSGECGVTLLPAGHIFGSAQLFLRTENDTLLYTGDFKLRQGQIGRGHGMDRGRYPDHGNNLRHSPLSLAADRGSDRANRRFLPRCDQNKEVPVLLGYSLGKAQEILCALAGADLTPMLHGSVYQMTRIYEQYGQKFCQYVRYQCAMMSPAKF